MADNRASESPDPGGHSDDDISDLQDSETIAEIHPTAVVCAEAEFAGQYKITIGADSVLHPGCRIEAITGPVVLGKSNVLEELAVISNKDSLHPGRPLLVGDFNLFEVRSCLKNTSVGNCNTLEVKSTICTNTHFVGNGIVFCVGTELVSTGAANIKDYTADINITGTGESAGSSLTQHHQGGNFKNTAQDSDDIDINKKEIRTLDCVVVKSGSTSAEVVLAGVVPTSEKEQHCRRIEKQVVKLIEVLKDSLQKCHYLKRTKAGQAPSDNE